MKSLEVLPLIALTGLIGGCVSSPETGNVTTDGSKMNEASLDRVFQQEARLEYLIYEPAGSPPEEGWPLVLFLHGAGERGSDLALVKTWGPPRRLEQGEGLWASFPAIVVAPQCPDGQRWNTNILMALLDEIEESRRVDPDRVYVTGMSMGGYGTWALADRDPDRFAAIAPICGGYPYLPYQAKARLEGLPIWAFHGDQDTVVPVEKTLEITREFEGDDRVRVTIFEGVDHNSWEPAYSNPELWEWMLAQRRSR